MYEYTTIHGEDFDEDDVSLCLAEGDAPAGLDVTQPWPEDQLWGAGWSPHDVDENSILVYVGRYHGDADHGGQAECERRGYRPGDGVILVHRIVRGSRSGLHIDGKEDHES